MNIKQKIDKRKICKNCRFWAVNKEDYNPHNDIIEPLDPDTYKPMKMPFEVKVCMSDNITWFERNPNSNGVSLVDGSDYYARMLTGENFGCVNFKKRGKK